MEERRLIATYKGIEFRENSFEGYWAGEGQYAVYCGEKKFPFKTYKAFQDAVNGKSKYPEGIHVGVPYIENEEWGSVPLNEFAEYIRNNN